MSAKRFSLVLPLVLLGTAVVASGAYAQSGGDAPPEDAWIAGNEDGDADDGAADDDSDRGGDGTEPAAGLEAGEPDNGGTRPVTSPDPVDPQTPEPSGSARPTGDDPDGIPSDGSGTGAAGSVANGDGGADAPAAAAREPDTTALDTATGAPIDPADDTVLSADEVEDEDEEHVGRHNRFRLFYAEVSAGYSWLNLGLVRNQNLDPQISRVKDTGFAVGAGLGFFISFITLGVQTEIGFYDAFNIGTITLDVGFRIPTPHIEPYLRVGVGYAFLFGQDLYPDVPGEPDTIDEAAIRGIAIDVGVGFDFMITEAIAIGVGVDASLFNVRRSGINGAPILSDRSVDLSEDGNAIGLQVSGLLQLSFHF